MTFNPKSFKEFINTAPPSIDWLWEPYIPKGAITLLSAYMKVGKSTFAYALISALVNGKPFLGFSTTKSRVLLMSLEGTHNQISNSMVKSSVLEAEDSFVNNGPYYGTEENCKRLGLYAIENKIDLIVIDTLSLFVNVEDENDNAQMNKAFRPIRQMAYEFGITILLIHHDGKAGGEGGRATRGASAIFASVDQLIQLSRIGDPDTRERTLTTEGRYDETPRNLVIELTEDYEYINRGTHADAAKRKLADKIVELLLKEGTALTANELKDRFGITKGRVDNSLPLIGESGIIRYGNGKRGDPFRYGPPGLYGPPPAGIVSSAIDPIGKRKKPIAGEGVGPGDSPSPVDDKLED